MNHEKQLRPGVSNAFLAAAGVAPVCGGEAKNLCGLAEPGLWIPYRTISGKPVTRDADGPLGYGRLRLAVAREDRKYHQRAGSAPYAFLPHNLADFTLTNDLVVVEGEFKALALAEAGIAAVGIGGINLAFHGGQIVPGLREVLHELPSLARILFLGDGDTSLLMAFSREAVKLAKKLPHLAVACPRIGLDGPGKGIDDVREVLGAEFAAYWASLIAAAEPVSTDDTAEQLAVRLLLRETPQGLRNATGLNT
jgi:hypothetical protein